MRKIIRGNKMNIKAALILCFIFFNMASEVRDNGDQKRGRNKIAEDKIL